MSSSTDSSTITNTDSTLKDSPGIEDEGRKSYIPIATSTPVSCKGIKSVSSSGGPKAKSQIPRLSPIGNRKTMVSNVKKNKTCDEVSNPPRKDKSKVGHQSNDSGNYMINRTDKETLHHEKQLMTIENRMQVGATNKKSVDIRNGDSDENLATASTQKQTPSVVVTDMENQEYQAKECTDLICYGGGEDYQVPKDQSDSENCKRLSVKQPPLCLQCKEETITNDMKSKPPEDGRLYASSYMSQDCKTSSSEQKPSSPEVNASYSSSKALSPSMQSRRRLSFTPVRERNFSPGRRASEIPQLSRSHFEELKRNGNSADSLKTLNRDLKDQIWKMRGQLDNQRGSIRQTLWQKVVDTRQIRQQEQQRLAMALNEQFQKLEKEKQRELEHLRAQQSQKFEAELQKSNRFKDAEISKLKQELSSKNAMLQRLLGESRPARMKLDIDDRKHRLIDELKQLRQAKKELKFSLENANFAERAFSTNLRRHSETFESEITRVRKEAQIETRQLVRFNYIAYASV